MVSINLNILPVKQKGPCKLIIPLNYIILTTRRNSLAFERTLFYVDNLSLLFSLFTSTLHLYRVRFSLSFFFSFYFKGVEDTFDVKALKC